MGWSFKWLSSGASAFNFDYYVSFPPEEAHNRTAFYNYASTDPVSCGPFAGHDEEHAEGALCVCNEHILCFWRRC